LVGYFVLGPSDLYKLVKEIGKFIQNFRTLGAEATKTFENTMETQLELEDLRKAQRELNDAFSFRRSINVDQDGEEAFAEPERGAEPIKAVAETGVEAVAELGVAGAAAVVGKPKKRVRRRKKKAPIVVEEDEADINGGDIPDLDMSSAFDDPPTSPADEAAAMMADEERVKAERLERLTNSATSESPEPPSWFDDDAAMPDFSSVLNPEAPVEEAENNRFSTQLTDDWNAQIMANEDKLSPLAQVMERLAILEEEKNAADARLEEEFLLRTELEEKYYREKRNILEEAAAEVQANAYLTPEVGADSSTETV
jgi:Sec-independent protein translocase protein TatA